MPRVGFEPTTPVFDRAKTVHALGRAAAVIGGTTLLYLLANKHKFTMPVQLRLLIALGYISW
jgi:hypothetical protein